MGKWQSFFFFPCFSLILNDRKVVKKSEESKIDIKFYLVTIVSIMHIKIKRTRHTQVYVKCKMLI